MMKRADSRQPGIDPILVPLFACLIFVAAHFQALTNPFFINDDVQQQIYWMQQWQDKALYPGFWLSDYSRHYVPWGVQGIYRFASLFLDPISFSKVLSGLLFVLASISFYRIGQVLKDRLTAWTVLASFWLMPFFLFRMSGGLARGFAFPLLALLLLFWLSGRGWSMGWVLLCMALTIPYIFILSLIAVMTGCLKDVLMNQKGLTTPFPSKIGHWVLVGIGIVALLWWRQQYMASGFGPLVTAEDMVGNPEFGIHGRYPILPVPSLLWELVVLPWQWIGPYRETGSIWAGILGSLVVLGIALRGARRFEWKMLNGKWQPFLYLGISSLLFYVLARIFLLKLFIPSRYLTYTLNVSYCVLLGICFRGLLGANLKPLAARALLAGVVGLSIARLYGIGVYDYSQYEPLYRVLNWTPKTSLIAGHPRLMDNVLTFGRRNVFASFELAHPWSKGLWQKLRPRLVDLFDAYYAEDSGTVMRFCRKYRIDFLVVDNRHFTTEFLKNHPFFDPFDRMIREAVQNRRYFVLVSENFFPEIRITQNLRLLDFREMREKDFDNDDKRGAP